MKLWIFFTAGESSTHSGPTAATAVCRVGNFSAIQRDEAATTHHQRSGRNDSHHRRRGRRYGSDVQVRAKTPGNGRSDQSPWRMGEDHGGNRQQSRIGYDSTISNFNILYWSFSIFNFFQFSIFNFFSIFFNFQFFSIFNFLFFISQFSVLYFYF